MANSTTSQISQYYPTLQPLLTDIQNMIPPGQATNAQQNQALQEIVNRYNAENNTFKELLSSSLGDKVNKFQTISSTLQDYNEIYNTNKYIHKELNVSERDVKKMKENLKNNIYIAKQKSQMYEYKKNKFNFYKAIFLVSCFIIVDLLSFTGLHLNGIISSKTLYMIMGVSVVIYLIIVMIIIYSNSFRSNFDWNKFNWESVNSNTSQGSCKA
jgi:hypothetical protein